MQPKRAAILFKILGFIIISILLSCKKEEAKPQIVLFHPFNMAIGSTQSTEATFATISLTKNVDTACYVYVQFYISSDLHYSEEDKLIGTFNSLITTTSEAFSVQLLISGNITYNNYLIAKYRAAGDSNAFFTNTPVYYSQTQSLVTLTSASLNNNVSYFEGEIANLNINYFSTLYSSKEVSIAIYVSSDSFNIQTEYQGSSFYRYLNAGNSTLDLDVKIPNVGASGTYYLITKGSYDDEYSYRANFYWKGIPITIKSVSETLDITTPIFYKSTYSTAEAINFKLNLVNPTAQQYNADLYYYLSSDTTIDNSDLAIDSDLKVQIDPGSNSLNLDARPFYITIPNGSYYFLIRFGSAASGRVVKGPLIAIRN